MYALFVYKPNEYEIIVDDDQTIIIINGTAYRYTVYIDARGQKPLTSNDIPFPSLRKQLLSAGAEIPEVDDDYTLLSPDVARGRIAFAAIPYLIHDNPFIQGITASAEIGAAIAQGLGVRTQRH